MRIRLSAITLAVLLLASSACNRQNAAQNENQVRVLAAASLVDLFHALDPAFKQDGLEVQPSFGSSSLIRSQIEHRAPADLFISASTDEVLQLRQQNLLASGTEEVLFRNRLVLVAPLDSGITGLEQLRSGGRLGIGDPKTVPAGRYAEQSLRKLGLWDAVQKRLVIGTDVRVVLGWVARGEVDAAIIYDTDRRAQSSKVKTVATLPDDSHDPILYAAAIPASSVNRKGGEEVLRLLRAPAARKELRDEGFEPVMEPLR